MTHNGIANAKDPWTRPAIRVRASARQDVCSTISVAILALSILSGCAQTSSVEVDVEAWKQLIEESCTTLLPDEMVQLSCRYGAGAGAQYLLELMP